MNRLILMIIIWEIILIRKKKGEGQTEEGRERETLHFHSRVIERE
jgi:hypothetical protein